MITNTKDSRAALLAAPLAAAGAAWVALIAGGSPALLLAALAAPLAAALIPIARPTRSEAIALVALAAAAAVGALDATLELLDGSTVLKAARTAGRDLLLALAVSAPAAAALTALRGSPVAPPVPAEPVRRRGPAGGTSRRGFLQLGAASGVAVAGLSRAGGAGAQATAPFLLTITEGDLEMVDGTPVFFRGFRASDATVDLPQIPGPAIGNTGPGVRGREVFEGQKVTVVVANSTPRDHTFLIEQTDSEKPANPVVGPVVIPAHETKTISFTAPGAGSYIYRDADRNNRLLGMYGALVVQPVGVQGRLLPYAPSPDRVEIDTELRSQHAWILSDVDPVLGELARAQRRANTIDYPLKSVVPRYFLINGETGVNATKNEELTIPVVPLHQEGEPFAGVLIRCINTGVATHSLHWHGNHVFPVSRNGVPERAGLVYEKDVQRMEPLQCVDVILPAHTGFEAFPPLNDKHPKAAEQHFPMHCHAEMSQTAAGGSYPFGMLTDWHLVKDAATARQVRARLADERRDGRAKVPEEKVQAAFDDVVKNNSGPGNRNDDHSGSGSGSGSGSSGKGEGKD